MDNHVHVLCTPNEELSLIKIKHVCAELKLSRPENRNAMGRKVQVIHN